MNQSFMLWRLARSADPHSRYDRFFGNLLVYTLGVCVIGWLAVFGVAAVCMVLP